MFGTHILIGGLCQRVPLFSMTPPKNRRSFMCTGELAVPLPNKTTLSAITQGGW